jgi:hypothetical protein
VREECGEMGEGPCLHEEGEFCGVIGGTAVEDFGPLSLLFQRYRFGGSCLWVYRRNRVRKPERYDASTLTKNRITGQIPAQSSLR